MANKGTKTRFNWIGADWTRVKNHCRTTDNKDFTEKEPTEEFKRKLLISEHSPIRLLEIDWSWNDIYSWVATHWSRHKFEKFISTQRDDRTENLPTERFDNRDWVDYWDIVDKYEKEHGKLPRGKMLQEAPVNFDGYANMQSLIDSFRKRLCYQASPDTRELAEDFKMCLHEVHPELADVLVPNCIYRFGCPEFRMCKERCFMHFLDYCNKNGIATRQLINISDRYKLYNQMFYATK